MNNLHIPGFEMMEKLGEGGMATVWKARQISLDRIVAIKILSSRLASDPADIQRFQKEAQSAAKLKHPGIVQVYDASAEKGIYYFVMEFIDGYTVGDWVRRKGYLPEKDALLVAECLTDALGHAWKTAGIIHCDIKPDNVMIDADGTVKVADLGLARSISTVRTADVEDEITGTPCYMAPEQSAGDAELDCRADIYSLGAMLYHLTSGTMLFEGNGDEAIMDMQISGQVEDVLNIKPEISKAMGWLIEKMLVKDKKGRQKDWDEVRADIIRVKNRHMPRGWPPPENASTMKRSSKRTEQDFVETVSYAKTDSSNAAKVWVILSVIGIVIGTIAFIIYSKSKKPRVVPAAMQSAEKSTTAQMIDQEKTAREMYEFVKKWQTQNPDQYNEAIMRYKKVSIQTKGTKYALLAEDEIAKIKDAMQTEIRNIIVSLNNRTESLINSEEFDKAANIFEKYDGKMAQATKTERIAIAERLRARQKELNNKKNQPETIVQQDFGLFLDKVVGELLSSTGVNGARVVIEEISKDFNMGDRAKDFQEIKSFLEKAANINERILNSFRDDVGRQVDVQLLSGVKNVEIVEVRKDQIIAKQIVSKRSKASVEFPFSINDLSIRDRLMRMGPDDFADVALVKGLIALNAKAYPQAKKYFSKTHPLLVERLMSAVETVEKVVLGDQ